jgi:hypothetical protein
MSAFSTVGRSADVVLDTAHDCDVRHFACNVLDTAQFQSCSATAAVHCSLCGIIPLIGLVCVFLCYKGKQHCVPGEAAVLLLNLRVATAISSLLGGAFDE